MTEPKGDKLFVNLGASQARRRLKKFGHGVRKIQSAGKNQAVIIHTATGRHLEELEARFADVGCSPHEEELSAPRLSGQDWRELTAAEKEQLRRETEES